MCMQQVIELAFELADGVIDCRLDPVEGDNLRYSATILYPQVVNGYTRSEIFCHDLVYNNSSKSYEFENMDNEIHPKILKLESRLNELMKKVV